MLRIIKKDSVKIQQFWQNTIILHKNRMSTINVKQAEGFVKPKYYEVGMNLTDTMFSGNFRGSRHFESDMDDMLRRAKALNVEHMLLTGSDLDESKKTIEWAKHYNNLENLSPGNFPSLTTTVGVHPCSVTEFTRKSETPERHINKLREVLKEGIESGIVKAFGEIGLDYDRLHYSPKEIQKEFFELQLKLACEFELPLFLHMRAACDDFLEILLPFYLGTREDKLELKNKNLLVHSFSGSVEELAKLIKYDHFYISVNGCSLREESNLEAAKLIPLDKLMIETDAPWCEIKKTHASYKYLTPCPNEFYPIEYELISEDDFRKKNSGIQFNEFLPIPVLKSDKFEKIKNTNKEFVDKYCQDDSFKPMIKSRNEPCLIGLTAQVMSKLKDVKPEELINACYENSRKVFD